jgi:hypothetical protein
MPGPPAVFALHTRGVEGFRDDRPDNFIWGVFVPGDLAMLAGLIRTVRDCRAAGSLIPCSIQTVSGQGVVSFALKHARLTPAPSPR